MSEENSFGDMLNTAIRRMGWTQQEVADKFNPQVNRVTVNRWARNLQPPSSYHLNQLVTILGLNEDDTIALYRAAKLEPPKRHNLSSRNRLFTGRESYLALVVDHFKAETTVALSGLPGIGKTQLALEYAHRCDRTQVYSAVLWVKADTATLQASYADLAQFLDLPERKDRELGRRVDAVKQWLKRHTNWLLIMDNADDLELACSFFPDAHRGHILLTTSTQIIGGFARKIEIEKMAPEEGLLFLLRRSSVLQGEAALDTVSADTREAARQVVGLLDGHPLALDQAGAFIEDGGLFTTYIDLYDKQRRDLLARRGSLKGLDSDYPGTVAVTFALCFNKAREQHPLADDILSFCAFLHPDAIPEELFQHDDSFNLYTLAFTDGITSLLQYSLLTRNMHEKTFTIHRLVQAVLSDDMPPDLQKQWRERVVRALNAAFPAPDLREPDLDEWLRWERSLPHTLVCLTWTEDELTPTVEVAELFHKAGIYLPIARGQYLVAETLLTRVRSIYEQNFGVEHPTTASARNDLAIFYFVQGKFEQTESLYQQALTISVKYLGYEHPETAKSMRNLAGLHILRGKHDQAEPLLVQVLSFSEKHFGDEHPETYISLVDLAFLYTSQGKHDQAELLHRQATTILYTVFVDEHPATAISLNALAMNMHLNGDHEQADALYQRVISVREQRLGATHPHTHKIRESYAAFLDSIGRDAEAEALEMND